MSPSPIGRRAFTLIELLVVIAIIGVLVGLLLPAAMRVKESTAKVECMQNMQQLGLALLTFHDQMQIFPNEQNGGTSFLSEVLPYLEQKNATTSQSVPQFVCIRRRGDCGLSVTDFAAARHSGAFRTILGGRYGVATYPGTTLNQVQSQDGTTRTLLLSHKSMNPDFYADSAWATAAGTNNSPDDKSWSSAQLSWAHYRDATAVTRVRDEAASNTVRPNSQFGSPHASGIPSLRADGGVSNVSYSVSSTVWRSYWWWNDRSSYDIEE